MNPDAVLRSAEIRAATKFHLRGTAAMTFVIYWLMVLTYQEFFLFNPSDAADPWRQATLWLALVGWILAAVGSPLAMLGIAAGSRVALAVLPVTALWWPVSIVLAQISAYAVTGQTYLDYLFETPIFVVTDIALPILLMLKWGNVRRSMAVAEITHSTRSHTHAA